MHRWLVILLAVLATSCQSTNQQAALQADHPGLGPLASSVQASRTALEAAAQQFESAGAQISTLAGANATGATPAIVGLQQQYDGMIEAAAAVGAANAGVDEAADSTFREWQIEAGVFTDARLKADSQAKLTRAWEGYQSLSQAQRAALDAMDPVLAQMNRTVSALGTNATAGALAAQQPALDALQGEIAGAVASLRNAAAGADTFIASLQ